MKRGRYRPQLRAVRVRTAGVDQPVWHEAVELLAEGLLEVWLRQATGDEGRTGAPTPVGVRREDRDSAAALEAAT